MKKICIGLIGAGKWGRNLLRVFYPITELKYYSNRTNRDDEILTMYPDSIHTFDYKVILDDPKVEGVIISTPISSHYEIVKEALSKGKHVFVEKPMCIKYSQALEISRISKQKGLVLFTGYLFLYDKSYLKLKEIVQSEGIEKILFFWEKFGTFGENIVENLLTHDLSMTYDLLQNDVVDVYLNWTSGAITKNDLISLSMKFDGLEVNYEYNRVSNIKSKKIYIRTKKGNVYVFIDGELFHLEKSDNSLRKISVDVVEPLKTEADTFIACVQNINEDDSHLLLNRNLKVSNKVVEWIELINSKFPNLF